MKKINWKFWTIFFIFVSVAIILSYDIVATIYGGGESSISNFLISWSYKYPLFTLCVGIVLGHLFWRFGGDPNGGKS